MGKGHQNTSSAGGRHPGTRTPDRRAPQRPKPCPV